MLAVCVSSGVYKQLGIIFRYRRCSQQQWWAPGAVGANSDGRQQRRTSAVVSVDSAGRQIVCSIELSVMWDMLILGCLEEHMGMFFVLNGIKNDILKERTWSIEIKTLWPFFKKIEFEHEVGVGEDICSSFLWSM